MFFHLTQKCRNKLNNNYLKDENKIKERSVREAQKTLTERTKKEEEEERERETEN